MIESLSIAVHGFVSRVSMSFLVDETLLPISIYIYIYISCLVVLFYDVTTRLGLFKGESSHFDKFQTIQFSIIFCSQYQKHFYFKQFLFA